jgi:heterotetrameric sarcosine oxidase gamma subunit
MLELERASPLGLHPRALSFRDLILREERTLSVGKIVARALARPHAVSPMSACGLEDPPSPRTFVEGPPSVIWYSPTERLLLGAASEIEGAVDKARHVFADAALTLDLSHAFVCFRLTGAKSYEILASMVQIDLDAAHFPKLASARALFGECGVTILCLEPGNDVRLLFDQSYADYAWDVLEDACVTSARPEAWG